MNETIIITVAISAPISGIIGYFIRVFIEDRLSRSRNIETIKITEFNKTAAVFRDALLEHKIFLQDLVTHKIYADHVPFNISDIEHAKGAFEFYLVASARPGFNKTWDQYKNYTRYYPEEICKPHNKPYPTRTCNEQEEYRLKLIDELLQYALPIQKQ